MKIHIPSFSLIMTIGPSGCGKSSFCRHHFLETEVVSSDRCRAWLCDDEGNQEVNADAFGLIHYLIDKRLKRRRLTVLDATNLLADKRQELLALARSHVAPTVALCWTTSETLCLQRQDQRKRRVPSAVIHQQFIELGRSLESLPFEGFHSCVSLPGQRPIEQYQILRLGSEPF